MIHSSGEGTGERLKKAVGFGVKVSSITRQTLVLPVAVVLAGLRCPELLSNSADEEPSNATKCAKSPC